MKTTFSARKGVVCLLGALEAATMLAGLAAEVRPSDAATLDKASQAPVGYEIRNIRAIPVTDALCHAWSPDGRKIAVTIKDQGIYVINVADGAVKKLTTDGGGYRFCWSPDSREIVYLATDFNQPAGPNNCIRVVDIETAKITALTDEEDDLSRPAFYKEGVIYSRHGTLVMHRGTTGKGRSAKSYGPREVVAENVPANGIVPVSNGDGLVIENDSAIEIMDDNAGHGRKPIAGGRDSHAFGAMVSPRGDKILYHEYGKIPGAVGQECVYDIASKKTTDLAEGHSGQWLPDGRVIYYVMEDDGHSFTGSDMYIIDAAGANKLKIANTPGRIAREPAVSPDGKSISYQDTKSGKVCIGELKAKK